jgi:hypothetical protein
MGDVKGGVKVMCLNWHDLNIHAVTELVFTALTRRVLETFIGS